MSQLDVSAYFEYLSYVMGLRYIISVRGSILDVWIWRQIMTSKLNPRCYNSHCIIY